MLLYHTVFKGVVMEIDSKRRDTLAQDLAPRWERTFTFDQIRRIILDEKNQTAAERGMNVYGYSEIEAWNKVLSMAFHQSI
jgi:hypothetical protein